MRERERERERQRQRIKTRKSPRPNKRAINIFQKSEKSSESTKRQKTHFLNFRCFIFDKKMIQTERI